MKIGLIVHTTVIISMTGTRALIMTLTVTRSEAVIKEYKY
jgi:hypothetical protein